MFGRDHHACGHACNISHVQVVSGLRAEVAVGGAGALQRAGWLDAAQNILDTTSASASGPGAAAMTAEARLRLALAQVRV